MAKKNKITLEPQIEATPFTGTVEEDIILRSPRKVTPLEIMSEEGLPWYTKEDTSLIVERKTDTQTYTFEKETILNTKTKPTEEVPELYTLSSGSISEVVSPLEQKIGNYFKLKDLISYDYNNPLYYELNNYPGIDKKYNGRKSRKSK